MNVLGAAVGDRAQNKREHLCCCQHKCSSCFRQEFVLEVPAPFMAMSAIFYRRVLCRGESIRQFSLIPIPDDRAVIGALRLSQRGVEIDIVPAFRGAFPGHRPVESGPGGEGFL